MTGIFSGVMHRGAGVPWKLGVSGASLAHPSELEGAWVSLSELGERGLRGSQNPWSDVEEGNRMDSAAIVNEWPRSCMVETQGRGSGRCFD